MPTYQYRCPAGHLNERFRPMTFAAEPVTCATCGADAARIMSAPHVPPDGVYSYAPNVGSEAAFERKRAALKTGQKVYAKESS